MTEAGHDAGDSIGEQFGEIHAAPALEDCDVALRGIADGSEFGSQEGFFELDVLEVVAGLVQAATEVGSDGTAAGVEVLDQDRDFDGAADGLAVSK